MILWNSKPMPFELRRLFALAIIAWLLLSLSPLAAQAQSEDPINKERLLRAIGAIASYEPKPKEETKQQACKHGIKYLIQRVQRFGVDFELTKDSKSEIETALTPLHEVGVDVDAELIGTVRDNYRPNPEAVKSYNLGVKYHGDQDYESAIKAYGDAIKREPKFAEAYYGIGLGHYLLGRDSEAKEAFEQAKGLKPEYSDAYYCLGLLRYKAAIVSGQPEKAIEDQAIAAFKKATEINQEYADAHFMLGQIYYNRGLYQEAIPALKQAIAIQDALDKETQSASSKEIQTAVNKEIQRSTSEVARAPSEITRAHYYLGRSYFASPGMKEEAIKAYTRAIQSKPNDAESHYGLGLTYYNLDRYAEAIEPFKKALEYQSDLDLNNDPNKVAKARYYLGRSYFKTEMKQEGLAQYNLLAGLDKNLAKDLAEEFSLKQ